MNLDIAIKQLSEHPDANERAKAADFISSCGELNESIISACVAALNDTDPGVKDICSRILSSASEDFSLLVANSVAPMIISTNIELRNLAGEILIQLGENSASSLIPFFKHNDSAVRQFALDIVGKIGNEQHSQFFLPMLEDNDPNVVNSAIEALGNQKASHAIDTLISIFAKQEEFKPTIIESLGKIGGNIAKEFILQKFAEEDSLFLKTACIDALAICGDDISICNMLMSRMNSTPEELQGILLKTIYAIAFRNQFPVELPQSLRYVARQALMDDDFDIRAAGLIALGDDYQAEDITSLINEILKNNPDTQQMILSNLFKAATDTIELFFKELCMCSHENNSVVDFLAYLPDLWIEVDIERQNSVLKIIYSLLISNKCLFGTEIMMILLKQNRHFVIELLTNTLHGENAFAIEQALEFVISLDINELHNEIRILKDKKLLHTARTVEILNMIN